MRPYFEINHFAGLLLLIVSMGWGAMELAKASSTREGATRIGGAGRRLAIVPTMAASGAALYLAPRFAAAAAIRPAAVAFAAGIVVLAGGLVLRGWSIMTLGDYFTGRVMVSADQPVITAGPYRVLRHPSYTGFLLACARDRPGGGELGRPGHHGAAAAGRLLLAHPGRGERPAGHARRPVRLLRRAAQAPRPVRLVTRPAFAPGPGPFAGCAARGRPGGQALRLRR